MIANKLEPEQLFMKKWITFDSSTSLSLIYTFTAPVTGYYNIIFEPVYVNSLPQECCICTANNTSSWNRIVSANTTYSNSAICNIAGALLVSGTKLYVYARYNGASSNGLKIFGRIIKPAA